VFPVINRWLFVAALTIACVGCGSASKLMEAQRVRSGSLDVVLLSSDGALHQKAPFTMEFRSASDGTLIDVGAVRASANMPMPGMAPMLGSVEVRPADTPGRYTATASLDMAGGWRIALEWDGAAGRGAVNFTATVQ
jgi:hypothetical protein